MLLHSIGGLGAIGAAAPKKFRFAKCEKEALVLFTGSSNRLHVSQLTKGLAYSKEAGPLFSVAYGA